MKVSSYVKPALLLVLLTALAVLATPALSAPPAQANLLRNGDFESGTYAYNGDGARNIPNEWAPWWNSAGAPPRYNSAEAPNRVKSGARAASVWEEYRDFEGGLMQIVPGVTAGTIYRFTIWGHAWSTTDRNIATSNTDVQMKIGIDPTGGNNPASPSIVWSGTVSARDTYQLFSVDATATGTQITVWVSGKTTFPVTKNDFYWDAASLVAVGQAAPAATNTPGSGGGTTGGGGQQSGCNLPMGSIPRATPQPDGSIIHTVSACETLSGLEFTYGVSIDQIRQLNNLQSNIIYPGQQLIIQGPQQAAPPTDTPVPPTPTPSEVAEQPESSTEGGGGTGGEAPVPDEALAKGTICVLSWEDINENRLREPQEPMLAGVTFMLTDSANSDNTETYTTDGVEDWHCFSELSPSNYTVTWTAEDFAPTTDQTWIADLTAGETLNREFGAVQGEGGAAETNNTEDKGGLPPLVTAGIAALGVIFLLTGIGAAGYFFLARRAQISS